jgi:hypothetical protein
MSDLGKPESVPPLTSMPPTARESAEMHASAAAGAPGQAPASDWWVCDGILPPRGNGQKIIGPFATQELALSVRTYVEKAGQRTDLWVDDEPAAQEPHAAAELAKLRLAAVRAILLDDNMTAEDARSRAAAAAYGDAPAPEAKPAPELAAAMRETRTVREGLDAIRDLCEARMRIVGMVDGKGVARKVIAIIDKLEGK